MLEKATVRASDYRNIGVANAILSYEHVEDENYLVLHRVHVQPTNCSDLLLECPLDDEQVRAHFEYLLSVEVCNMDVKSVVTA